MSRLRYLLLLILIATVYKVHAQQDMDLHLSNTFLPGKNILKIKRDFHDPYLWVLAKNNEVYRINSVTKQVDDFSDKFTAYGNFRFTDIAGVNKELVFVATNADVLLEYKNSALKKIGNPDGVPGAITSIGTDYTGTYVTDNTRGLAGRPTANSIIIGTDKGMCHYDYDSDVMLAGSSKVPAKVFDATYRTEMFSDLEYGPWYPGQDYQYDVIELTQWTIYGGWLYYKYQDFANSINTACYTYGWIDDMNTANAGVYFIQIWGTEDGIFQNNRNYSYTLDWPHKQYLKGININKVTSILGLVGFGYLNQKAISKENVLAGTDNGLYFTNSGYKNNIDGLMGNYTFFHYDPLGNKKINDICVNATSYTTPVCEDGVWVAAIDGLYLLKPDFGAYVDKKQQLQAIQFEGNGPEVTKIELCANVSINAYFSSYVYNDNIQQWYKDGKEMANQSGTSLSIKEAGEYYVVMYDPCSEVHFESNHLTVTQVAAPVFSFNYPDVLNYCAGSSASLKTDDKPNYQYRWYKDGVLNGNTTATLDNITETAKYKVEVSACAGNWVASKEVQVNFITIPTPVLATDKASYCDGDQATLSAKVLIDASAILNWTSYQYAWYKDGSPITGSAAAINVSQPGKYKVTVSGCSGSVSSAGLQVDFIKLPKPVVSASKPAYCIGDMAQLIANVNIDPFTTVSWLRDGNILPDEQDKASITTNIGGNYTVTVVSAGSCSIASSVYNLGFTPPPTVSIQQIVNTTLCDGQTVDLKASYTSGTVTWSTGATSDKISIQHSGTFKATVTTTAGCTVDESATVQYFPNPTLNVPSATLCQYTNESITLTAPAGFVKYEWNGQPGTNTFTTNKLGSVILTVTDNNGCQASQTIAISSHCDDIHIPNAFSPNGDGHNDTWVIAGLEGDPTTTVRVYNRLGSMVFQSQGYATPWNGTYNGSKLPASVYYYVISTKGTKQVLSGSVTIFN
ncbi:gliding motility-associated C-terminal domain-containing protein [Mucilaginibacter sp. KACC 22773]|uniref:gliding motility-associated C-terminal domain-containing protein n=1 Tax=Mucilaginibacter sp. KACC 22773 TaxID=3025671 RepID=UPI002365C0E1|nr:gliding motility-associated C-terminal domain-containing protein [Mucilaginibacter sp. KACC 22773]WDF76835.1 gliding motility-associated C-terminal domain-containing protein [Mucilaginibacter sp. KACC 22773]